ncbi:D-glycero-alpha-D-manno-heptose-1,7-bisphosphate 7-phosphatase [Azospirillum argentinense]
MPYRALLLDRDGVVNIDHGYVGARDRFTFVDGIFDLARLAADRGFRIAVITNQSGIARGYFTESAFLELSGWMCGEFRSHGIDIAGVFHCPYHPDARVPGYARDSFWRKPNPGMILEAARRLDLDLGRSVFLGDQPTDMEAARAAGVGRRALLSDSGEAGGAATLTVKRPADLRPHLL